MFHVKPFGIGTNRIGDERTMFHVKHFSLCRFCKQNWNWYQYVLPKILID